MFCFENFTTRHFGKEGGYGALRRRRDWGNMGWRGDHFRSMGKLEGEV